MTKKILTFVLTLLCCSQIKAQTYNPFVQNIQFLTPPTSSGYECGSAQTITFTQGISTATSATQWQNNPMTISICLTGFVFEGSVSSVISGPYAANFNWSFDEFAPNCLIGIQNQTLPGIGTIPGSPNPLASGSITINVKVPENSALAASLGVNVNLQLPGYMSAGNIQSDDLITIQTIAFCSCYNFIGSAGSIGGNQTFFNSGDPIAFTSNAPGSGGSGGTIEYQWQELLSSTWTDISGATSITYDAPATSISKSYRRKAKRTSCGTWKNTNPVNITIVVPNAGLDKNLNCNTPSAIIGTASLPGNTYSWSPTTGLSASNVAQPLASPLTTTTYTMTMTNNSTGLSASDIVVVNVDKIAPGILISPSFATICNGSNSTLTGIGGTNYVWMPGSISAPSINVSPNATTTYTVTGTSANGCTNQSVFTLTVNPSPTVGSIATLESICPGIYTTLTGTGADIYTWNFGASYSPTLNVSPAFTTTYAVIGTNTSTGCTSLSLRTIVVNPLPTTNTTTSASTICAGTSTTITGTGANSYTWQPGNLSGNSITVSPLTTTTYTVTGTTSAGCTKTSMRTIVVNSCGSVLNLKLYIEGYYIGAGSMASALLNQSVAGAASTITDSITVELRNQSSPYAIASSIKTILNTDGTATCNFPISGTYYIVVKHRNAIETWSANPISISAAPTLYDFTTASNKAYGNNMKSLPNGLWALYSGDMNFDENIDLLDLAVVETDINEFKFGYFATDINGDGNVDLLDSTPLEENTNNFVFASHP